MGDLVRRWFAALPEKRREKLATTRPTIDLDPTDVEVYGSREEGVAFTYKAQRVGRLHPAVWAEAGVVLASDVGSGRTDPRPRHRGSSHAPWTRCWQASPPDRARRLRTVRQEGRRGGLANHCDFAIAVRRSRAVWRAEREMPEAFWQRAKAMEAEVAECDDVPAGWPASTRCICRRVRVTDELRPDTRTRRPGRSTNQLVLLEAGEILAAHAYSFILTNLTGEAVKIEHWFRQRALIEERLEDSKVKMALRHLPSG
jgi:hypothetical protein